MKKEEYQVLVRSYEPKSPLLKNCLGAFVVGGLICCLGQLLKNAFLASGLDEETAGNLCSISLIFLGVLLTGLNVYDDVARFAGAGTLVPITGFANSVAAPAMEFRSEGVITGMAVKMFSIAGPVIVFGTFASTIYGVLLVMFGVF